MDQTTTQIYLPGTHSRARWMRMDAARILKRFYFCERALIVAQSGWLAGIAPVEIKLALPGFTWQDAMTAHALRERVFEMRFPSRLLEVADDAPIVDIFAEAINAPSAGAFLLALARIFKPALLAAYQEYVSLADELSDGPILRALRLAIDEKSSQIAMLTRFAAEMLHNDPAARRAAESWLAGLSERLLAAGGLSVEAPTPFADDAPLPGRIPFAFAEIPARDSRFHLCRYYWPDIVDASFGYGEGINLQLRSAISHFNEVWAVETGGAVLHAFADVLEWEFIDDAARWTYDEARHTRMGYERLQTWGYVPAELPLGTYIFDSARGQDPVIRLAMLHYFETKNIGKKTKRANAFASYNDRMSQHDMDFDWADETIHAEYGHRWLDVLHALMPERAPNIDDLRATCDALVAEQVAAATPADVADIRQVAAAMIAKAGWRGVASEEFTQARVLILHEPTRGIDVGAKAEIYTILRKLAENAAAVLIVSSELPELMGQCDRILVLHKGNLTGAFARTDFAEEPILACAMGHATHGI